jgi:hypothetical protein
MFGMLRRMVQIGACAAILAVWQLPAYAAPAACVAAWRNADKLVKVGQLRAAKVSMLKCAHYTCGGVLSKECGRRVAEIENDTPTIVPVVKDEDGDALADVSLAMDGELVANRIDGRAVMVDPGTHEFTFQRGNRVLASYKTTILQGQRNRTVEVSLDGDRPMVKTRLPPGSLVGAAIAPSASGAAAEGQQLNFTPDQVEEESGGGRRITNGTLLLGAVGALGVAGYAGALYQGNKENRDLDICAPGCRPEAVDRVRKFYQAAKISLGIGAAALVGAGLLYFTSDGGEEVASKGTTGKGYQFALSPTQAGGMAAFSGSF